jgi:segregation and condensation protein B
MSQNRDVLERDTLTMDPGTAAPDGTAEAPGADPQAMTAEVPSVHAGDAAEAATANLPADAPGPGSAELMAVIEALVFASPDPMTPKMLCTLLADEPKEDVMRAIEALRSDYDARPGLQMVEVAGGYQIVTRPELHEWVRRLFHERSTQKLSVQALETLAVIAYKQPITALEISDIRGVNTSGVLTTLLERHLIKIVGRKNVVGRPFLYATTREFLMRFGLKDLSDLPRVEDMAEALGFDPPARLTEHTPADEVLPLEEPSAPEIESHRVAHGEEGEAMVLGEEGLPPGEAESTGGSSEDAPLAEAPRPPRD